MAALESISSEDVLYGIIRSRSIPIKKIFVFDFDLTLTTDHTKGQPNVSIDYFSEEQFANVSGILNDILSNPNNLFVILSRGIQENLRSYVKLRFPRIDYNCVLGAIDIKELRQGEVYWAEKKAEIIRNLHLVSVERGDTPIVYFFDDTETNIDAVNRLKIENIKSFQVNTKPNNLLELYKKAIEPHLEVSTTKHQGAAEIKSSIEILQEIESDPNFIDPKFFNEGDFYINQARTLIKDKKYILYKKINSQRDTFPKYYIMLNGIYKELCFYPFNGKYFLPEFSIFVENIDEVIEYYKQHILPNFVEFNKGNEREEATKYLSDNTTILYITRESRYYDTHGLYAIQVQQIDKKSFLFKYDNKLKKYVQYNDNSGNPIPSTLQFDTIDDFYSAIMRTKNKYLKYKLKYLQLKKN
jgi:hypothetical protein